MALQSSKALTIVLASSLFLSGCGSTTQNGVAGGFAGAAVGAGTGALVGSAITNGDVVGSAVLGGAIGIPVGIAIGVALTAYDSEAQYNNTLATYERNQLYIEEQESEIMELREEVLLDAPVPVLEGRPSPRLFHGSTLGSAR